jgi:hypothetical protein
VATVTVQNLIDQARTILQDQGAVRWANPEFLSWLQTAYAEIIDKKPQSNSMRLVFACQAGTQQNLPADGALLISVVRNESPTAKAIRPVERAVMDSQNPDWHNTPNTGDVTHYVYEAQSPKVFYVYPQANDGQQISIQYAKIPLAHTTTSETIRLDDTYAGLLVDYLLYRAYAKDASLGDASLSNTYRDLFYTNLGLKPLYPARAITTA